MISSLFFLTTFIKMKEVLISYIKYILRKKNIECNKAINFCYLSFNIIIN